MKQSVVLFLLMLLLVVGCKREPELHLYEGVDMTFDLPLIDLELDVYWDYELSYDITYDWRAEWYYDWDEQDIEMFGEIGYTEPTVFCLRRYYTGQKKYAPHTMVLRDYVYGTTFQGHYNWGYWDILVWNDIVTLDGVQSLHIDEETSLDYVTAYTNQSMNAARYQAPRYTRSFYAPEPLFAAYSPGLEINENLEGFEYDEERGVYVKKLNMVLVPVTYIYLTQVILHNNKGRITHVDGPSNLSGMARSVVLNTGVSGPDPVTVNYSSRLKFGCKMNDEVVDIIGGRLMTFGMCNQNPNSISRGEEVKDEIRHYMDVTMQFYNGMDSTIVFDVTDQVRKRYKGGVLTVELDVDDINIPSRSGGSGFDAVVKEDEEVTHEIEM